MPIKQYKHYCFFKVRGAGTGASRFALRNMQFSSQHLLHLDHCVGWFQMYSILFSVEIHLQQTNSTLQ
jgi:hypothetical protein